MNKPLGHIKSFNVLLAGQPNTGKSTLFNRLTGARQHVGNWPGKTIEQKKGYFNHNDHHFSIIDLPGTYSLNANSAEEAITRGGIVSEDADVLIAMVDASQIHRSMYLLSEIAGIGVPVVVACSMVDIAESHGKKIDIDALEKVLGVPVVGINATNGQGVDTLKERLTRQIEDKFSLSDAQLQDSYSKATGRLMETLKSLLPKNGLGNASRTWLTSRLIEGDAQSIEWVRTHLDESIWIKIHTLLSQLEDGALKIASSRYEWIESALDKVVTTESDKQSYKIGLLDRFATHWFTGKFFSIFMVLIGFAISFLLVIPLMFGLGLIMEPVTSNLNQVLESVGASSFFISFVVEAIIPGIHITCIMVFYVVAVVFIFGIMEDIGLIARFAFVFDRLMGRLGLNGKSVLPFISGLGCNIAAVVGARVIDSDDQRRTTIVTSMVVPCLGVWGVLSLISSIFFGANAVWVVLSIFPVMIVHIAFTAWLFRGRQSSKKSTPGLIMELPPYHKPNWRSIFLYVFGKTKSVTSKAGTAIFLGIILVWAASYSSTGEVSGGVLYSIGKTFEPISMLVGFDWRLLLAFLISAFAKEATLGAIAIFFGLSQFGTSFGGIMVSPVIYNSSELAQTLGSSITQASALAFIFAFFFNVPCLGTVASIRAETHSTKFALLVGTYYLVSALIIAAVVYRIGLIIF